MSHPVCACGWKAPAISFDALGHAIFHGAWKERAPKATPTPPAPPAEEPVPATGTPAREVLRQRFGRVTRSSSQGKA